MPVTARICAAVASAALLIALAGCTPTDLTPVPQATGSAPAPSVAPVGAADTGALASGDCSQLLDPDALATDLGGSTDATVRAGNVLLAIEGGLDCLYFFGSQPTPDNDFEEALGSGNVTVTIAPLAIADPSEVQASLTSGGCPRGRYFDDDGTFDCGVTAVVNGWWYRLSTHIKRAKTDNSAPASFSAINTKLESALTSSTPPTQVGVMKSFDCAAADTGSAPMRSARVSYSDSTQNDFPENREISAAAFLRGGATVCSYVMTIDDEPEQRDIAVYPGATAAYEQCTRSGVAEATPISIPGIASAVIVAGADGFTEICATDGVSTVNVLRGYYTDSTDDPTYLDDLSALLSPIFAAAATYPAPVVTIGGAPAPAPSVGPSGAIDAQPPVNDDCMKLVDSGELAAALGKSTRVQTTMDDVFLASASGLSCRYSFGKNSLVDPEVQVVVVPASVVDPSELEAALQPIRCASQKAEFYGGARGCTTSTTVNGWWYALSVTPYSSKSVAGLTSTLVAVQKNLEKKLSAQKAPTHVEVVPPFDCSSANTGGLEVVNYGRGGWDFYSSWERPGAELFAAAYLRTAAVTCMFIAADGAQWELTIHPNDTAAYSQCTVSRTLPGEAAAATLAVDGVEKVVGWPGDYSSTNACATDGTSTIEVNRVLKEKKPKGWDAKMRSTLGSLLKPVFAAAGKD
jgi:hypothetical protein